MTHIATSPLTGTIFAGKANKTGTAFTGRKVDVTSDVMRALIEKANYHGGVFEIAGGGETWTVTVTKDAAPLSGEK